MTPQDEGSTVDKLSYKNHEIEVVEREAEQELRLDGEEMAVDRDADTGAYWSPDLPFRTYGSLQELGQAMVDEGLASGQEEQ